METGGASRAGDDDPVARVPVEVATRAPGGRTNAYVIGTDGALLVDPAARTDALDAAVAERGVTDVLVTHTHPDHVGAVAEYANGASGDSTGSVGGSAGSAAGDGVGDATGSGIDDGVTVWALAGRADRFAAATGVEPDRTFRPGDVLTTGDGRRVEVLATPGHAPDHVALAVDGCVLAGDLVVAEGSVVVGADEGDLRAYLASLRRLLARDPARIYPGHGPVVEEPRETLTRLLAHRRERERRVLAAVEDGARTVEAVVDAAYDKDLSGVRDLASRTVEAHLEKLAVEGRVVWDGDEVRPG